MMRHQCRREKSSVSLSIPQLFHSLPDNGSNQVNCARLRRTICHNAKKHMSQHPDRGCNLYVLDGLRHLFSWCFAWHIMRSPTVISPSYWPLGYRSTGLSGSNQQRPCCPFPLPFHTTFSGGQRPRVSNIDDEMADPISVGASLLAFIGLADRLIRLSKYRIGGLQDAPSDFRMIHGEVSSLRAVVGDLTERDQLSLSLFANGGPLEACHRCLSDLEGLLPADTCQGRRS